MKKFLTMFLIAAVALVSGLFAPKSAEAIPAFARQMQVPCFSCHYQYIPKLNAFGREFLLGGYSQAAQELISDGEHLSIPPVLNAAFVAKFRYWQDTNYPASTGAKIGKERGVLRLPDEASLLVGGRVGENMGALVEFPMDATSGTQKFVYSKDFGGVRGGLTAYGTGGGNAANSMELFNTGAVTTRKQFENRNATSALQATGGPSAEGAASGIHVFAGSDLFFANLGLWGPAKAIGSDTIDTGLGGLSTYYRLAVTPKVADGVDLMVGIIGAAGKTTLGVASTATALATTKDIKTDSMAIDFQVQTEVAGMSLEVTGAYITVKGESDANAAWNTGSNDQKGMDVKASLGLSKSAGVKFAYLALDSGAATANTKSAFTLGGWYDLAQNVGLHLEYSMWSGDARTQDNNLVLLFEFAF